MLNFVRRDRTADVGGFGIDGRNGRGIDGHLLGGSRERQLHRERVRLLRNERQASQHLLLEACVVDGQRERVSWQCVEIKYARTIACPDNRFIGRVVLERKRGAGNDGTRGVGDDALNGGTELGMSEIRSKHRCEKNQRRENGSAKPAAKRKSSVDGRARTG